MPRPRSGLTACFCLLVSFMLFYAMFMFSVPARPPVSALGAAARRGPCGPVVASLRRWQRRDLEDGAPPVLPVDRRRSSPFIAVHRRSSPFIDSSNDSNPT